MALPYQFEHPATQRCQADATLLAHRSGTIERAGYTAPVVMIAASEISV
jgi:hypothetical protein